MSLNLEDVLNQLNGDTEKVASAPQHDARGDLRSAIRDAEFSLKTASAPANPAVRLEEMANKLASADVELMTKEAQTYGAAMADGFVTRLSSFSGPEQVKTAGSQLTVKEAEAFAEGVVEGFVGNAGGDNIKTAADASVELQNTNPELVKMASEVISGFQEGYAEAAQGQVKTAGSQLTVKEAEAFAEGVVEGFVGNAGGDNIKTAADASVELQNTNPELVKMASEVISGFQEGYAEGTQEQVKTASSAYDVGFHKTAAAIENGVTSCYQRGFADCDALLASVGRG